MSDNTLGGMYLAASERNAQRIADLQAEVERLRAQLAERDEWQPLPNGKHGKIARPTTIEIRADMVIFENRESILTAVFPDDLRLCRRKAKE